MMKSFRTVLLYGAALVGAYSIMSLGLNEVATAYIRAKPQNPLTRMEASLKKCYEPSSDFSETCAHQVWDKYKPDVDYYLVSCDIYQVGNFRFNVTDEEVPYLSLPAYYSVSPNFFFADTCRNWNYVGFAG